MNLTSKLQVEAYTSLLQHLYESLGRHDARSMAAYYHPEAVFHDIAFDLHGRDQILAMWQMICEGDIRPAFEILHVDEHGGTVKLLDEYTFTDTGRKVRNQIESHFKFQDWLIIEHRDVCDPRAWAKAALNPGIGRFLAGRFRFIRAWKAREKLRRHIQKTNSLRRRT